METTWTHVSQVHNLDTRLPMTPSSEAADTMRLIGYEPAQARNIS